MMMQRQRSVLVAVCVLLSVMIAGCSGAGLNPIERSLSSAETVPCPVVLRSDSPALDTPEGKFTLDRVEVWTAPDCLGLADPESQSEDPEWQSKTVPSYLLVYSWTNTTGDDVLMGPNYPPLVPELAVDGDAMPFVMPTIAQSMDPYELVAPGDSVKLEQWHYPRDEAAPAPRIPNEVLVFSQASMKQFGSIVLSLSE